MTGKVHKTKIELQDAIDKKLRELGLHNGLDAFDPVMLMTIIAAEAYDEGDKMLSLVALKEVAHYMRPKLQATKFVVEDKTPDVDVIGAKERFMQMAAGSDPDAFDKLVDEARTANIDADDMIEDAEVIGRD